MFHMQQKEARNVCIIFMKHSMESVRKIQRQLMCEFLFLSLFNWFCLEVLDVLAGAFFFSICGQKNQSLGRRSQSINMRTIYMYIKRPILWYLDNFLKRVELARNWMSRSNYIVTYDMVTDGWIDGLIGVNRLLRWLWIGEDVRFGTILHNRKWGGVRLNNS